MIIERCSKDDIDQLVFLESLIKDGWTSEMLINSLEDSRYHFYKATDGVKAFGFIGIDIIFDEVSINNIAVDYAYQRQGIASELIDYIKEFCRSNKIKVIFLEVNEHNRAARALYEKNGFKIVSTRKNYYNKDSAIIMNYIVR